MSQSGRKFAGVFVLMGIVVAWAVGATAIHDALLADAPGWLLIGYYAVAGLGWFLPAAVAIRWMLAPPAEKRPAKTELG
ncbi:MAG TPA: DUF2842 domain-containing protein [Devosiaceae bacterium]|nr:DUF2842 domain-containing protein [Devosiaceae bacterium]